MNPARVHPRLRIPRPALAAGAATALAGFTVVEMLLVVAIVALLTIGVAQVFRVTGETVKAGKRISNLTTSAARIEKQFRADFAALSREGFMVMRHRTAGGTIPYLNDNIGLTAADPAPRHRRVDELVFFITGDFVSERDPVYPSRQATATQARVYYGQGYRKNPASSTYYDPIEIDDLNNTSDTPKFGRPGPNHYASDWMLLRHLTLLCQPSTVVEEKLPTTLADPNPVYTGGNPNTAQVEDLDSNCQIRLQPAAPSIFRYINSFEPSSSDTRFTNACLVRDEPPKHPQFASGIVDIATTDLTEIRAIVLDAQLMTARNGTSNFSLSDDLPNNPPPTPTDAEWGSFFVRDADPSLPNTVTKRMHTWMRNALPANSDAGERMRYELQPPNFLGTIGSSTGTGFTKEYQRTDQAMLTASNFAPGCSEFIVEWSFGDAYPSDDLNGRGGQLIWHGLQRDAGVTPTGQPAYAALPYASPLNRGADWYRMPYRRLDGTIGYWPPYEATATMFNPPINRNVVGEFNGFNPPVFVEYSYFGYIDPTYRLRSVWTDVNNNGRADPGEMFEDLNGNNMRDIGSDPANPDEPIAGNGDIWFDPAPASDLTSTEKPDPREPSTIPWPWPKLVRITMSLVDPSDPLREQTFQFVLEVPRGINDVQD